jgi:hypothetical protein
MQLLGVALEDFLGNGLSDGAGGTEDEEVGFFEIYLRDKFFVNHSRNGLNQLKLSRLSNSNPFITSLRND